MTHFGKTMKVRLTLTEEMLGTASGDPELHRRFIASKAPDAEKREEEIARLGVDEVLENTSTVFHKLDDGTPVLMDYHIKGCFKDACGMLRSVSGTKSKGLTSYKKKIDGAIFVDERFIPIRFDGEIGHCERSLRAQTPKGERTALASSESVPAGATMEFTIRALDDCYWPVIREWLDYGALRGLGCWRNSGKGKFTWEELESPA